MWRPTIKHFLFTFLIFVVLVTVAFAPAVRPDYGRADDYVIVYSVQSGSLMSYLEIMWASGRIIPTAVSALMFAGINSVSALEFLRWVVTIEVALAGALCSFLTWSLSNTKSRPLHILMCLVPGVVVVSLPSIPNFVTWATFAPGMYVLPLSVLTGALIAFRSKILGVHWIPGGAFLVIITTFSYQSFAPLVVVPVALSLAVRWARRERVELRRLFISIVLVGISLVANMLCVLAIGGVGARRLSGHTLSERWSWLVREYLPRTVDLQVPWSWTSTRFSLLVLIVVLLVPLACGRRYLMASAAVIGCWIFVSGLLSLSELWASYRLVGPAQIALWGGASFVAVTAITSGSRTDLAVRLSIFPVILISVTSLVTAGMRAYDFAAVPNMTDWESTKCVAASNEAFDESYKLRLNHWWESRSPVHAYDEYGIVASSVKWALQNSFWLALREVHPAKQFPAIAPYEIVVVSPDEPQSAKMVSVSQKSCSPMR